MKTPSTCYFHYFLGGDGEIKHKRWRRGVNIKSFTIFTWEPKSTHFFVTWDNFCPLKKRYSICEDGKVGEKNSLINSHYNSPKRQTGMTGKKKLFFWKKKRNEKMQTTSRMLYYYHFGALKRGRRKKKQITSSQVRKREKRNLEEPLPWGKILQKLRRFHILKQRRAKKKSGKKRRNRELIAKGVAYVTTHRYCENPTRHT